MIDIQKLRALLDAADMQLPLEVVPDLRPNLRSASNTGGFLGCGHIATMSRYDRSEDDAALIAGAVNTLPEMLDEVERLRAGKSRHMRELDASRECFRAAMGAMAALYEHAAAVMGLGALPDAEHLGPEIGVEAEQLAKAIAAIASERDALRVEVDRLRARKAEMCDCVHATGMIGETLAYVEADCPKCGGSGGVVVEATP